MRSPLFIALIALAACGHSPAQDRRTFQTAAAWTPRTHLDADVAIVYGMSPKLPEIMETWRRRGYRIEAMTAVNRAGSKRYVADHPDEAQTDQAGNPVLHGAGPMPYMSATANFGAYLIEYAERAIAAGAEAIHLEEPEFFARAGYEACFKREWKAFYGEEWQPPHSSIDAQYRASKLKYVLFRRVLSQVFDFVRARTGGTVPCYVPTHSLLNYAHWRIVSPESSLLEVGCDGYIAQVWTGTARVPNVYENRPKERTFETAFLEYGAMQNLVRASGRKVWYLNDPVEDDPTHTWDDYRANWESTLVASLLQPEVWRYEIMPWPHRVFDTPYAIRPGEKVKIPKDYETELQAVIRALGDMEQPARWEVCGTRGTGVLVSDTMMFQRHDPGASDGNMGSFYGLALPLLKRGLPVVPVQIETADLKPYRLLLLTYEGQKPPKPDFHGRLAEWVKAGGALVVIDDDKDPYNAVKEWWNTAPNAFAAPRHHLFAELGLPADAVGPHRVGKGVVVRESASPARLTYDEKGAASIRALSQQAAAAVGLAWEERSGLVLRRGPYVVAAGLDESVAEAPAVLRGRFVNLFDASLPVVSEVAVAPGLRVLLVDLDASGAGIVAAACRMRDWSEADGRISFRAEGIDKSTGVVRIAMARRPAKVRVDGREASFDYESGTVRITFVNSPDGVTIEIE